MQTETIPCSRPDSIERAMEVLKSGGLIAFPTDTVYGLAAAVDSAAAIDLLFEAKTREFAKAIAVLVGSVDQLHLLTPGLPDSARRLAERFWPGALTLVVPKRPDLPDNLSVYATIGVRMPNHAFALALLQRSGPLATTSANRSGAANATSPDEVLAQLDGRIHLLLDGGPCPGGIPSTVVDCTQSPPQVLRKGAISEEEIQLNF
jgi:L-threonylcarbamoyladenylate synthase